MKPQRPFLTVVAFVATSIATPFSTAAADTITGRVVDANNVGVAGVDIDVKNLGSGGDPDPLNDGTDAEGFFTATIPAGVYRVTFTPPPPPTTTHLVTEVDPVIVVGATAMGTIVLPAGVSLGAHVENSGGSPVANVNIDVIDHVTGDNLNLANDFTDAFGNFLVAVPANAIELRLNATSVVGPKLASTSLQLAPNANTTIPDVTLAPGLTLNGVVRDSNGTPVEEADIDVFDTASGAKIYTPGEETNATGVFTFVVPAGVWDIEFCPLFEDRLVGTELSGLVVNGSMNLGLFVLEDGVVLSGTVRDFNAVPIAGADIDVLESGTGASVVLCRDNTASNGTYAVVVPTRTLDVRFEPPSYALGLGRGLVTGVAVGGPTNVNGVLPACANATNYGTGLAAPGGLVPHITSSGGAPSEGNTNWAIELEDGVPGGTAIVVLSLAPASISRFGGTILVSLASGQAFTFAVPLDASGNATFDPGSLAGAAGFTGYAQFAVHVPARGATAAPTWTLSEGLRTDFCY